MNLYLLSDHTVKPKLLVNLNPSVYIVRLYIFVSQPSLLNFLVFEATKGFAECHLAVVDITPIVHVIYKLNLSFHTIDQFSSISWLPRKECVIANESIAVE